MKLLALKLEIIKKYDIFEGLWSMYNNKSIIFYGHIMHHTVLMTIKLPILNLMQGIKHEVFYLKK